MAMATGKEERAIDGLPYGVGKLTAGWWIAFLVAAAIFAFGLSQYWRQLEEGEIVTGMRDVGTMGGAPWGLYIVFVVYFIGVSFAGIVIAALIRLMDIKELRPVARIAELLTVITIILGALSIIIDIGRPERGLINLFLYARPQSPFFGTFTLVTSGYLFASLVYFYLDARRDAAICAKHPGPLQWLHRMWAAGYRDTQVERERHRKTSFWLALGIVPLLVTAHSTLGFVFGLQVGRPGWFSALQAPGFVVLAGVSGVGLLIVVAALLRRVLGEEQRLGRPVFKLLGLFLLVLTLTYLYFILVDLLTGVYAASAADARVTAAMLTGAFSGIYWSAVALLALSAAALVWMAFTKKWSIGPLVLVGLMVNVAAIEKRYLIVVPSQTVGMLMPYEAGSYSPTMVEIGVILGLFALGAMLFLLFMKAFPILPVEESGPQ